MCLIDNWNEENEPEDAGTIARASKEELERRVIIKAKRRATGDTDGKKSAFSGFSGFGTDAKPAASTFSFLNKTQADTKKSENANGVDSYPADIKKLNNEFAKWIQKCVDSNPLCILTPIFDDYKTYLKEIEAEKSKRQQNSTVANILSTPITFGSSNQTPSTTITVNDEKKSEAKPAGLPPNASTFKFGDALSSDTMTTKTSTSTFSFGNAQAKCQKTDTAPTFSFNSGSSATMTDSTSKQTPFTGFGGLSKPFSFGSTKPFSFGNVTQVSVSDTDKKDENKEETGDDEDQPPKVEFTPVVEEDSLFSKRCKVFVKVDKEFKDRGVGTLYVKSVEDGEKTQVIVRADTSLGNLLLNMLLSKETPTSRTGKNNVMVGTVVDGKPTSVLIRVKTTEDADELLATLEENKK